MKMFRVSTLQALMLGYSKAVISVDELLGHGNTGIGTGWHLHFIPNDKK
jgi:acetolactate decarboxylase